MFRIALCAVVLLSFRGGAFGQEAGDTKLAALPAKENFHLFLLVGQSNMAGRGKVEPDDRKPHPRVLMLDREGRWVPAADPMHWDKPSAGVGLGRTFGMTIAETDPTITVGLIPCAHGGSPIDVWQPDQYYAPTKGRPWNDAISRAKIALDAGTLKGILWHQGESDAKEGLAEAYGEKLIDLANRFRNELAAPDVPFLVGGIGTFDDVPWNEFQQRIDAVHRNLPNLVPVAEYVSSAGLAHQGDKIHFDAASYREFGKRYAAAYLKLAAKPSATAK